MPTENQNTRYSAGFNPISVFPPKRFLVTNEDGYATVVDRPVVTGDVQTGSALDSLLSQLASIGLITDNGNRV